MKKMNLRVIDRASVHRTVDRGFFTPEALGKTRRKTPEGYLVCEGVPIARTGMQIYRGDEIDLPPDQSGNIRVERTPDQVFHPDTVASFEGKSVTIDHPPDFVNPHNRLRYEVGHVQNVRRGSGYESDLLIADLVIKDSKAIRYANSNMPQISSGYNADYVLDGPGLAHQTNIIGNHVALVAHGRAGPRVAIRDSLPGENPMTTRDTLLTPDTILEAETAGTIITLGEVWTGVMKARSVKDQRSALLKLRAACDAALRSGVEPALGNENLQRAYSIDSSHPRIAPRPNLMFHNISAPASADLNKANADFWAKQPSSAA